MEGQSLKVEYGKDWKAFMNDGAHPQFKELLASLKGKLNMGGNPTKKALEKGKGKGMGKPSRRAQVRANRGASGT